MLELPQSNTGPQWNSDLLKDLAFIKKHLRYPFSKKTLPSSIIVALFAYIGTRMFLSVFLVQTKNHLLAFIAIAFIGALIFSAFYNYYLTLRFVSIPTVFYSGENQQLVYDFLRSQQLAVYRHPDAPEVFQIVGRPVDDKENAAREIMIFIADDKRILINSHFINQKYSIAPPSRNYRKMANRLREWLNSNYATDLPVKNKK